MIKLADIQYLAERFKGDVELSSASYFGVMTEIRAVAGTSISQNPTGPLTCFGLGIRLNLNLPPSWIILNVVSK